MTSSSDSKNKKSTAYFILGLLLIAALIIALIIWVLRPADETPDPTPTPEPAAEVQPEAPDPDSDPAETTPEPEPQLPVDNQVDETLPAQAPNNEPEAAGGDGDVSTQPQEPESETLHSSPPSGQQPADPVDPVDDGAAPANRDLHSPPPDQSDLLSFTTEFVAGPDDSPQFDFSHHEPATAANDCRTPSAPIPLAWQDVAGINRPASTSLSGANDRKISVHWEQPHHTFKSGNRHRDREAVYYQIKALGGGLDAAGNYVVDSVDVVDEDHGSISIAKEDDIYTPEVFSDDPLTPNLLVSPTVRKDGIWAWTFTPASDGVELGAAQSGDMEGGYRYEVRAGTCANGPWSDPLTMIVGLPFAPEFQDKMLFTTLYAAICPPDADNEHSYPCQKVDEGYVVSLLWTYVPGASDRYKVSVSGDFTDFTKTYDIEDAHSGNILGLASARIAIPACKAATITLTASNRNGYGSRTINSHPAVKVFQASTCA